MERYLYPGLATNNQAENKGSLNGVLAARDWGGYQCKDPRQLLTGDKVDLAGVASLGS